MADTDALYLENLDEFVNDENKIVTTKWLSNSLQVPSNKSKEMLKNFVEEESKKDNQLTVTYLVGGTTFYEEGKLGYRYIIVKEDNIEEIKSKFETVTCCHIYSVQKSSLKNAEMLCNADVDVVKTSLHELSKWSGINCSLAKRDENPSKRSSRDAQPSTFNGYPERNALVKETEKKIKIKEQQQNSLSSTKKNATSTSFFGAANNKNKDKNPGLQEKQQSSEKDSTDGKDEQTNKSLQNGKKEWSFFGKPLKGSSALKPEKANDKKSNDKEVFHDKKVKADSEKKKVEIEEQEMEVDVETTDENDKPRSKKKSTLEEETNHNKHGKTIVQESDSEEDDFESFIKSAKSTEDNFDDNKSLKCKGSGQHLEEEKKVKETKSAEEKPRRKKKDTHDEDQGVKKSQKVKEVKEKSQKKRKFEEVESEKKEDHASVVAEEESKTADNKPKEKRRIRKRVLKSKTFMNDEGYMVTEKAYESESATEDSENESEVNKKPDFFNRKTKDITEGNKKLKLEASKHKTQASLMSFFKKK